VMFRATGDALSAAPERLSSDASAGDTVSATTNEVSIAITYVLTAGPKNPPGRPSTTATGAMETRPIASA